jgi:hypothetical protein
VRNNSAEDTSKITRHEGNHKLSTLTIGALFLGEDSLIELLDNSFESDKLNNGVWNLSGPKWLKTFIETVKAFGLVNNAKTLDGACGEGSWF